MLKSKNFYKIIILGIIVKLNKLSTKVEISDTVYSSIDCILTYKINCI